MKKKSFPSYLRSERTFCCAIEKVFCKTWLELFVDRRGSSKKPRSTLVRTISPPREAAGFCNRPSHMIALKMKRNAVIDHVSSTMRNSCVGSTVFSAKDAGKLGGIDHNAGNSEAQVYDPYRMVFFLHDKREVCKSP